MMRLGALKARQIIARGETPGTVAKLMRALKGRKRFLPLFRVWIKSSTFPGVSPLAIICRAFSALEEAPTKPVRISKSQILPSKEKEMALNNSINHSIQREVLPIPDRKPIGLTTYQVAYDGGGLGKGGTVTLYVDGKKMGEGRVERTHPFCFSMDETTDVGSDVGAPVSDEYGARGNEFNGKVKWVQIDIDAAAADVDHMIKPEERFMVAMAKQ
jgi:hypothetical protein